MAGPVRRPTANGPRAARHRANGNGGSGPLPGVPGGVPRGTGASGQLPPGDPRRTAVLVRNWWALAARGGVGLLFGVAALVLAVAVGGRAAIGTGGGLVWLLAAYLFVDGVFGMLAGLYGAARRTQWGALVTDGLAGVLLAALFILWTGMPREALIWLLIIWGLFTGVLELAVAQGIGPAGGRSRIGAAAGISLATGVLLALTPPTAAVWLLGLYGLAFGAAMLAWGLVLRGRAVAKGRGGSGSRLSRSRG